MEKQMFIGNLIHGDFQEKTMTFEIENEMILQAGKYVIVPNDDYEKLVKGAETSDSNCNLQIVSGWHFCPKCGMKLHISGQCANQLCSGFSKNAYR